MCLLPKQNNADAPWVGWRWYGNVLKWILQPLHHYPYATFVQKTVKAFYFICIDLTAKDPEKFTQTFVKLENQYRPGQSF